MIILDTNVVSELMRESPDPHVIAWINCQKRIDLSFTSISLGEIQRGLARLPRGKRRLRLEDSFSAFINEGFRGRLFPYDEAAAYAYGEIAAGLEQAGINTDAIDLMIASIARVRKASIATRNVNDFKHCGIKVINPWVD